MPYPNWHAARIEEPDKFKRIRVKKITDGIYVYGGPLKNPPKKERGEGKATGWHAQAYRFDKKKFTVAQARKWLKDHNVEPISFEPAKEKSEMTAIQFKNRLNEIIWRTKNKHVIGIKQKGDKDFTREDKLRHYQKNMDTINAKLLKAEKDHVDKKNAVQKAQETGTVDAETFKKLLDTELKARKEKEALEVKLQNARDRYKKANKEVNS